MTHLNIRVIGTPKAQPRARACIRGSHAGMYNPVTADDWKACVAQAVNSALESVAPRGIERPIFTGSMRVDITVIFARPKNHFRANGQLKKDAPGYHITKPDRDNLDKAILDVLTQQAILADDKIVCDGRISKRYALIGEATGALINLLALY